MLIDNLNGVFRKTNLIFILGVIIILLSIGLIFAQTFSSYQSSGIGTNVNPSFTSGTRVYGASLNPQFSNPNFLSVGSYTSPSVYWPGFNDPSECYARQDFVLQIAPGGCSPSVVRSDLLEEQNVPVFCKVMAIQINPLIDVSKIRSLRFTGDYPEGVSGISYFPARAGLSTSTSLESSPVDDNLGYLVVVLSKNEIEGDMPEFIGGNITATIDYDVEEAFGVGNTNFYVSEMDDEDWLRDYKQYGFWNGRGYIRADAIYPDEARISIYRDANSKQASMTLKKGETSKDVYLSGYFCSAGMNIRLVDITAPVETALIQINDQQVWVALGDRILEDKCRITSLDSYGGGGKVGVSCPVQNGKFDLTLNPGKASFSNNALTKEYLIGDEIDIADSQRVYLGYVGKDIEGNYAVLVQDNVSYTKYEFADKEVFSTIEDVISRKGVDARVESFENSLVSSIKSQYRRKAKYLKIGDENIKVMIVREGVEAFGVTLSETVVARDRVWDYDNEEERLTLEYFDFALTNYEDLADLYPAEKRLPYEDSYAAKGLYEAALLSKNLDMNEKANELYSRLIQDFPDSQAAINAKREKELLMKYDNMYSKAVVYVNNEQYFIDLLDFRKPSISEASVVLLVDGKEKTLAQGDILSTTSVNGSINNLIVEKIDSEYASIRYGVYGTAGYSKDSSGNYVENENGSYTYISGSSSSRVRRLREGESAVFGDTSIRVMNINIREQAKLDLDPKRFGPRTESEFSFKIGIEKRGIKLSPDKTKEMIENLRETIEKWEDANEKLGNVIKGMKAACFATSALLTVKNLFEGLSGKSMARHDLMTSADGWNDYCEEQVNADKYVSVEKCLLENGDKINTDIDIYTHAIEDTNEILEGIQQKVGVENTDILDLEGQVDSKKVEELFKTKFDEFCNSRNPNESITIPERSYEPQTSISFKGENGICSYSSSMTHEQRKDLMTYYNIREAAGDDSVLKKVADKKLEVTTLESKNFYENEYARKQAEQESEKYNLGLEEFVPLGDQVDFAPIRQITTGDSNHPVYSKFKPGDSVLLVSIPVRRSFEGEEPFIADLDVAGKRVIVQVQKDQYGTYRPEGKIYHVDGSEVSENGTDSVRRYLSSAGVGLLRPASKKDYINKMVYPDRLKVEYFERAPYKGLPSFVPFDVEKGWYVQLTYVLSGFGKPYDESGRAVNYWICNVGKNGEPDFKRSLDDICFYYNGHVTGTELYGMTREEVQEVVTNAERAIVEASKYYGKSRAVINGRSFDTGVSFGGEEGRCSDFMSPEDCNLMFNVCDPVICPASRCDLGGRFRVDNVMQTGIIGSLMLCLPNMQEGIYVPICLTGVHSGIDGYLSILRSTVDCLNESIETGRNIGICDEIKSVYLCEFFWKQATPLMNVLIPRVLESFYSQGVRGGGEYLTTQEAWDNTQSAIDYFKNEYAVNSMEAFNARSTGEIGDEICKNYISASYPSSENFFDNLIEPDSPEQYHAWFEENTLTTATIPATSHYKVYYHIYAGKDQGAYYVIYLKDIPQSNYVYSMDQYVVDRGYVGRGGEVDRARDFTSVSGYKQLCVSINGQEECGFGSVTTSYALNSLADSFAAEQITTDIKSSTECVAGTPSLYSLATPNLQAGVEEVLQPELYNNGIVRVCSTENPGKQVLPDGSFDRTNSTYDRWKVVGYCDDPTIKCWLDTQSVKDVIKDLQVEEDVLDQVDLSILGEEGIWTEEQSRAVADSAYNSIQNLVFVKGESRESIENKISSLVDDLTKLTNLGFSNVDRARGHYLLGTLYNKIATSIKPDYERGGMLDISQSNQIDVEDNAYQNTVEASSDIFEEFSYESNGEKFLKVYNTKTGVEEDVKIRYYDAKYKEVTLSTWAVMTGRVETVGGKRVLILEEKEKAPQQDTEEEQTEALSEEQTETPTEEQSETPEQTESPSDENLVTMDDFKKIPGSDEDHYLLVVKVYDEDEGREVTLVVLSFNSETQEITLSDESVKKVRKDDEGRIVIEKSAAEEIMEDQNPVYV